MLRPQTFHTSKASHSGREAETQRIVDFPSSTIPFDETSPILPWWQVFAYFAGNQNE